MSDFPSWWQHLPSLMNPVIFNLGGFSIRWYGMMYVIAFGIVYLLSRYRIDSEKLQFEKSFPGDALTWAMGGVLLGGRLGYIFFYGFQGFLNDPLGTLLPIGSTPGGCRFSGISGMSYHGAVIGVVIAIALFNMQSKKGFLKTFDLFIPALPLGYTFGRLGNFINGELYGRATNAAIGMYFPDAPGSGLRHPSQLYEAFFEGVVLFVILWSIRKKSPFAGFLSGFYLMGYGVVRFFIEFYREPDVQLGFVFMSFSMGQVLCFLMIAAGAGVLVIAKKSARSK
ncbi:MAG: prolipoprotein diacylglyceryl transferase [Chlorobiaceae bacterium]|nr:prolipoprotein diacylglyceryl transferase [Chlorobiaceae bacterium]